MNRRPDQILVDLLNSMANMFEHAKFENSTYVLRMLAAAVESDKAYKLRQVVQVWAERNVRSPQERESRGHIEGEVLDGTGE